MKGGNEMENKNTLGDFRASFQQPEHVENTMKDKSYAPKQLHDKEQEVNHN